MKTVSIDISATFGSKFQEQFARESLLAALKAWQQFLHAHHKNNKVVVLVNASSIRNLDFFNFQKIK